MSLFTYKYCKFHDEKPVSVKCYLSSLKKHVVNLLLCRPCERKKEEFEEVIAPHKNCCDINTEGVDIRGKLKFSTDSTYEWCNWCKKITIINIYV